MVIAVVSSKIYKLIISTGGIIDIGERKVVRASRDYGPGKPRFILNLPTTRNEIWIYLWENKIPVKVFIELPEDLSKYERHKRSVKTEEG